MSFLLPSIDTWAQWSSLFDDIEVWKPAVDAICRQEGIGYHRIEAPASNTNAVFILDRRLVIKIYSPFWPEFAFERRLMELLQRDAAVPVPVVRAVGVLRDRRDWSYLAMVFCAGVSGGPDARPVTAGGRVLTVVGGGDCIADARDRAYARLDKISFEGAHWRTDIAAAGTGANR